jgi:hypothetical protein
MKKKAPAGELWILSRARPFRWLFFSMLQALPHTALWHRLKREGRLNDQAADCNQTTLMNFVPTRPMAEIASEYIEGFWQLYEPKAFFKRACRHYELLGRAPCHQKNASRSGAKNQSKQKFLIRKGLFRIFFRHGVWGDSRTVFWTCFWRVWRKNPGGVLSYLTLVSQLEHFLDYRKKIKEEILQQIADAA